MALRKHSFDSSFQVILEGVVGSGIFGDIAVDDLSLLGQNQCDARTGFGQFTILLKMLLCKSQLTLFHCLNIQILSSPTHHPKMNKHFA